MIELLARLGRIRTIALVTLISAAFSVLVTSCVVISMNSLGFNTDLYSSIFLAAFVPLIVAPLASWHLVGLLLHIYKLEEEMRKIASYDSLTGLLSRHAFISHAKNYHSLAQREKIEFSVLVVDLDHFKQVNDKYGHAAGDAVLKLFAEVAMSVSRQSDIVGRLGGEEFVFVLPRTKTDEAVDFSSRLHEAISKAVLKYDDVIISYTASIGIDTFYPEVNQSMEDLIGNADEALYQAKNGGRNRTEVFDSNVNKKGLNVASA